ncbi:MAG: T9SS type A sorting domain-containing protein [Saprospiraceae bacterium]|nr:T9SS type A sorting domain-containing protein [Saprospiraceae bacterium]
MKPLHFCICLLFLPFTVASQKFDNIWLYGYNTSSSTPTGIIGSIGDFSQPPLNFQPTPLGLRLRTSSTLISDAAGNLLFYTNGCAIANRRHEIMPNGQGLNPGPVHQAQCSGGYTGGSQSSLILPMPQSDSLFMLLHKGIIYDPVLSVVTDRLYYSVVNMSTDTGVVLTKNVLLISDTLDAGQLTAVKHANGIDWWVIVSEYLSNRYYILLLNESGLEIYAQQQIGGTTTRQSQAGGQAVFTPDGTKYIRYNPADGVFIFDFDRSTGDLSNFQHIAINDNAFVGGAAVSPNSRYLYIPAEYNVYQFDLWAADIDASRITVAEYDGFLSPYQTTFFQAQLAPDCKIYINSFAAVTVLHVIHHPDEPGLTCEVEQHGVSLPYYHLRSMPNFPNYRLGPLVPGEPPAPPCVPVVSAVEETQLAAGALRIFPNPAQGYFTIATDAPATLLRLYDSMGRQVLVQALATGQPEHRIALPPGLPAGVYVAVAEGSEGVLGRGRVVILE